MRDTAAAHRQRVTVLLADVQSSTATIQHLDPEDAARVLDPALDAMIDAVKAHQGTVVSVRGDGVLAIFGAPGASEDHTLRGCLAALAILGSVAAATPVRIGVHCGEVMIRRLPRDKGGGYDVVGVAVHLAARLEQTAPPGSACISDAAYELTRQFVEAEPLPPVVAKGLDRPLGRYRLLGVNQTASRWHARQAQKPSPFVGRAAEMAVLARSLEESRQATTLCQIHGPAGIGKSRLAQEFVDSAGAGCYVLELPGNPHARYTVLQPLTIWLRRLPEFRPAAGAAATGGGLAPAKAGLSPAESRQLQGLLGASNGGGWPAAGPDRLKAPQIAQLLTKILEGAAAGRHIIVVCDDFDNFDQPSRDILAAMLTRLGTSVLVIATSRRPSPPKLLPGCPSKALHLAPLAPEDARRLLASLSDRVGPDPAFEAECIRKAGGNPLFLEEVAGLVAGTAAPAGAPLRSSDIPDRVEALIADRLRQLPHEQRDLLQLAAVAGLEVRLPVIARLHGRPEAAVYPSLLRLQAADLLYETRRYPVPEFSFKHALIRDVAYNMVLKETRRRLHAGLVEILEHDAGQPLAEISDALCSHAIQAELWDKAVAYLQLAAQSAIERAGYRQAKDYLSLALDIVRKQPESRANQAAQIDILLSLCGLLPASGRYLDAESVLDDAEALVARLGDEKRYATIITLKVHLLNVLGDLDRALDLGKQAVAAARRTGDELLAGRAMFYFGQTCFNRGDFLEAGRAFLDSVELARRAPPVLQFNLGTQSVTAHASRAIALASRGDFAEAAAAVAAADELAQATRRPYELAFAAMARGFLELQQCRAAAAVAEFRAGVRLAEDRGLEHLFPPLMTGLGHALLLDGAVAEAAVWLRRAYEAARRHNRYMMQCWAATGLAAAQRRAGRHAAARRHGEEAVQVATQFGFRGFLVPALRIRGVVLADSDPDAGGAMIEGALALARDLGMRPDLAHCHAALARRGGEEAARHAAEAARLYRELGIAEILPHPA